MKTLTTILIATAMTAAIASAQPGPGQGPQGGGKMINRPNPERIFEKLDLTAEQRDALDQEQRNFQKQMVDLRADAKKTRETMRDLMDSATVSREEAVAALEAESAAELTIRKAMLDHRLKIREIVGPENAAKLVEMRDERREEMRERGGFDQGGHGSQRDHGPGRDRGFDDDGRGPPPEE